MAASICHRPHVARPGSRANGSHLKAREDLRDYAGTVNASHGFRVGLRRVEQKVGWSPPKAWQ